MLNWRRNELFSFSDFLSAFHLTLFHIAFQPFHWDLSIVFLPFYYFFFTFASCWLFLSITIYSLTSRLYKFVNNVFFSPTFDRSFIYLFNFWFNVLELHQFKIRVYYCLKNILFYTLQ